MDCLELRRRAALANSHSCRALARLPMTASGLVALSCSTACQAMSRRQKPSGHLMRSTASIGALLRLAHGLARSRRRSARGRHWREWRRPSPPCRHGRSRRPRSWRRHRGPRCACPCCSRRDSPSPPSPPSARHRETSAGRNSSTRRRRPPATPARCPTSSAASAPGIRDRRSGRCIRTALGPAPSASRRHRARRGTACRAASCRQPSAG